MKNNYYQLILFFFILVLSTTKYSEEMSSTSLQKIDCDLMPSVRTNAPINFHMNEVDSLEYKSKKRKNPHKLTLFTNSDSIEKMYNEAYPEIFKKTEKGYIFKSFGGSDIIVENNFEQEKSYSKYEFKAKFKNYVIISLLYFEGGEVVLVNLETGKTFTTIGKPIFINETIVYSYADYYGDAEIHLFNIESLESVNLSFQNLIIVDSYNLSNHIFFKAFCHTNSEEKYFEVLY